MPADGLVGVRLVGQDVARTWPGRVLGLPGPERWMRMPAITVSKAGQSWRCPAVSVVEIGRQRRSAARCTWWLADVGADGDPDDDGRHSALIRRNNTTGELAFYRCWAPRPPTTRPTS